MTLHLDDRQAAAKEHGILMSAPMVRALLAKRKTQTRRAVKIKGVAFPPASHEAFRQSIPYGYMPASYTDTGPKPGVFMLTGAFGAARDLGAPTEIKCPHPVGTRLWVRETTHPGETCVLYRADGPGNGDAQLVEGSKWTPSLLMPRSRARIFRDVTAVRVERAQAISDADIAAEGVDAEAVLSLYDSATRRQKIEIGDSVLDMHPSDDFDFVREVLAERWPQECWQLAWTLINGRASWDANPWCWVYEFKEAGNAR